jgi:hypothetical protein
MTMMNHPNANPLHLKAARPLASLQDLLRFSIIPILVGTAVCTTLIGVLVYVVIFAFVATT